MNTDEENEMDTYVTCNCCGEQVLESECKHEVDLGNICDYCAKGFESRGEVLTYTTK